MEYSVVAEYCGRLEAISGRNEMIRVLSQLLLETPREELSRLVYVLQGKLRPDFEGVELGLAEKMALRALSKISGLAREKVQEVYLKAGDIGTAAEELLRFKSQGVLFREKLTLARVYDTLWRISKQSGEGSVDIRIKELVSLLNDSSPQEARFIMRTVTGALRLGVADYTVLDACALAFLGGKEKRQEAERAYNVHPDLGFVVEGAALRGLKGVKSVKVNVGIPIRPMLAERLGSVEAIVSKMNAKTLIAEYKLDGERLQIHKQGNRVGLFSRRLEVVTTHYPDATELVAKNISAEDAILEAEVVAINEDTGEYLPFQELMHRRRKHGVSQAMKEFPIALNFFELLLANAKDFTSEPYHVRRAKMEEVVIHTEKTRLVPSIRTGNPKEIESFMEEAIQNGCEGLVIKDPSSVYRAGAREFAWIKLKREYRSELIDTIDLPIVGAYYGRGRRAGTYGAFLLAAYDDERGVFSSIAKIGTGFTDENLKMLQKRLNEHKSSVKPYSVESKMAPDVWIKPSVVLETIAAELTLSPIHTAALGKIRSGAGISMRFPKFTGRIREDKKAENSTTVDEIVEMYQKQIKRIK